MVNCKSGWPSGWFPRIHKARTATRNWFGREGSSDHRITCRVPASSAVGTRCCASTSASQADRHGPRPRLSPLASLGKGTTGGVVQTNEDPLPQKTRRPPWKRGPNVETPGGALRARWMNARRSARSTHSLRHYVVTWIPLVATNSKTKAKPLRIGLCSDCLYMRQIESARGSIFYQCGRSASNPNFPKYPRVPVIQCPGHEPKAGRTNQ